MKTTIDALVEALEGISKRCPTDSSDYKIASVGDTARAALAQARAEQAEPVEMPDAMRDFIEGMEVSVDVSTCEGDSQNRYFGLVSEVMDNPDSKHGVILLVQNSEPNFTPPAAPVAKPTAWRYTANGHVILMDGAEQPPDDAYDEGSLIGLAPTCKPSLQVPTDKDSLTVAPVAKLKPLTDDEVDALWQSSEKFQNPYLAYIHGVVDAEAAHNAKLSK